MTSKVNEHTNSGGGVTPGESDDVRMVLWTRRPVCGPRTAIIDRLSSLHSEDAIDEFSVETWPDEVALSEYTEHARVVEVYKEYLTWANEHDLSITPPFERRTASSLVGDTQDVLTVPVMCLAVYQDGLRGVYPCTRDGHTYSVADYLDAYEAVDGRPGVAEEVDFPVVDG
jgi:hypothetical protein